MEIIRKKYGPQTKILFITFIVLVHSSVWAIVNFYNSNLTNYQLNDLSLYVDKFIPYIGWTWPVYYAGHFYIIIGASYAIWNFVQADYIKIVVTFFIMILAGGIIQLILPAKSPLPEHMNSVHLWIHNNLVNDPFVCFPSMHVSLATLPTLLLLDRIKEFNSKLLLFIVLILISLSTITLKEHYFVDMIAGFAMGYLFYKLFKFQAIK